MNATTTPATYVDPYPGRPANERVWSTCGKCAGSGSVSWGVDVDAVVGGRVVTRVCFDCNGVGKTSHLVSSARATARRQAREAAAAAARAEAFIAEQAAKQAETDAKRAEFTADHGGVVDWITANEGRSQFAESLADTLATYGGLTERQVAAVRKIVADDADKAPVVEGRVVVTGVVLARKVVESVYGTTFKMRVRDDRGFTVYGTIPDVVFEDAQKGARVTFTATVTASDDDKTFGFYKRPSKAAVIAPAPETD